jgi:hypothetical protein
MLDIVKEFATWIGYSFLFLIFYSIFIQNKKYKLLKVIVIILITFPFLDLIFLKTIKTYYQLIGPIKTYNTPIINNENKISSIYILNPISLSDLINEKRISDVTSLIPIITDDEIYSINKKTKKWGIFDKKRITKEEILPLLNFDKFIENFDSYNKINDFVDIKIYDDLKYTKNQFIYIRVYLNNDKNHFRITTKTDIIPNYIIKGESIKIFNEMILENSLAYIDNYTNKKIIEINETIYFRNNPFLANIRENILHLTRERGRINIPIFKIDAIREYNGTLTKSFFDLF